MAVRLEKAMPIQALLKNGKSDRIYRIVRMENKTATNQTGFT